MGACLPSHLVSHFLQGNHLISSFLICPPPHPTILLPAQPPVLPCLLEWSGQDLVSTPVHFLPSLLHPVLVFLVSISSYRPHLLHGLFFFPTAIAGGGCRFGLETWEATAPQLTSSSLSSATCNPPTGARALTPFNFRRTMPPTHSFSTVDQGREHLDSRA